MKYICQLSACSLFVPTTYQCVRLDGPNCVAHRNLSKYLSFCVALLLIRFRNEGNNTLGEKILQWKDVYKKLNPGGRMGMRLPGLRGPATEAGTGTVEQDLHPAAGSCEQLLENDDEASPGRRERLLRSCAHEGQQFLEGPEEDEDVLLAEPSGDLRECRAPERQHPKSLLEHVECHCGEKD